MPRTMTSEIDLTTVHGRVKRVFLDTKLSQHEFADLVKIAQSHLCGIMKKRMPSYKLLQSIAEFTGANIEWLETGQGAPYSKNEPFEEHPELARVIKESVKIWGFSQDEFPESERYEIAAQMLRIVEKKRRELQKSKAPASSAPAPKQEVTPTTPIAKPVGPKATPAKKPAANK